MEKFLLLICAASALRVVSSLPARRYHFVYEEKTWTEAQSYCREKFTDLATVDSMEDVETLNNMAELDIMEGRYLEKTWIGLYDDVNSWKWSMSDSDFYKDGEIEFRNWAASQPDNYGEKEHCTRMSDAGLWMDVPCWLTYNFVCADIRGQDVTFVYIKTTMNFLEAQRYCREHHTDLASVRNISENQKIMRMFPAKETIWIGLFRDSWKWIDGRNLSFSHWTHGQPYGTNQNCVATNFQDSGKWADYNCDSKLPFICYSVRFSQQVVRLTLVARPSLNPTEPSAQEELLKQLKEKLKKQELKGDVKLNWRKQKDGKIFYKDQEEKIEL